MNVCFNEKFQIHQVLKPLHRLSKDSIFRIRFNMPYCITQVVLGQVDHGSNDMNKFYRNFFLLTFKVTLQDIQYFCSKQIPIRQLTNLIMCEITLRRGQLHCDHQKLNLFNKTVQDNNTLHLRLFLKGSYGFHYSLFFPVTLNLLVRIILF